MGLVLLTLPCFRRTKIRGWAMFFIQKGEKHCGSLSVCFYLDFSIFRLPVACHSIQRP
jgi:hypothetical protein